MTGTGTASGSARDAGVVAIDNVGELEAALAEARLREVEAAPKRRIEAAERAVANAKAQLAGAEDALKQAHKDNDAEEAGREAAITAKAEARAAREAAERAEGN